MTVSQLHAFVLTLDPLPTVPPEPKYPKQLDSQPFGRNELSDLPRMPTPDMDHKSNSADFTGLLQLAQGGDADAEQELFLQIEQELRGIAGRLSQGATSRGTSLVNEAYIYLFRRIKVKNDLDLKNRRYFFTAIADRMRKILLDRHRKNTPGNWDPALDHFLVSFEASTSWDYELLHDVLAKFLESDDPRQRRRHQLINLHFFAGMTYKAAATELGISTSQYKIDRDRALAELHKAMIASDA